MRRREVIAILISAGIWPLGVRAQPSGRLRTIGILMGSAATPPIVAGYNAFARRLSGLGWIEGKNLRVETRWANSNPQLMQDYARELASIAPDVILAMSNPALGALRPVAADVPIVFANVADPVNSGFVSSLAHPGGNITGFTNFEPSMGSKWLEILHEIVPSLARFTILMHPETAAHVAFTREAQSAAAKRGLATFAAGVHDAHEIESALIASGSKPNGGAVVLPHTVTAVHASLIVELSLRYKVPAVYPFRDNAEAGGLVSYGIVAGELLGRAADYVDRILRGAKPADLPVQAANKFELIINLKTANALGLIVPPALLARADEVIE